MTEPSALTDDELRNEIDLIEENLAETGPRSSYAARCKPVLRDLHSEAKRRSLR